MLRTITLPRPSSGVRAQATNLGVTRPRSQPAFVRGFQSRSTLAKSESNAPQTKPVAGSPVAQSTEQVNESLFGKLKTFLSSHGSKIVTTIAVGGVFLENMVQFAAVPNETEMTLLNHYLVNLQNSVIVSGLNNIRESISVSPYSARSIGSSPGILTQVIAHLDSKVEYVTLNAAATVKALSVNDENIQDMREYGAIGVLIDLSLKTGENEVLEALAALCTPIEYDMDFNTSVLSYGDILSIAPLLLKTDNPMELRSILKILASASLQYHHLSKQQKSLLMQDVDKLEQLRKSEDSILSGYAILILDMISRNVEKKVGYDSFHDIINSGEYYESQVKISTAAMAGVAWGFTRAWMMGGPYAATILKSFVGGTLIVLFDQFITKEALEASRQSKDNEEQSLIISWKFALQVVAYVAVMRYFPFSLVPSMIPRHDSIATTLHGTLTKAVDI